MKKLLSFIFLCVAVTSYAQDGVGINTTTPDASSALDIVSTSKGILIPRLTLVERDAITNPATGLLIYQIDVTSGFYFFNGNIWQNLEGIQGPQGETGLAGTNGVDGLDGTNGLSAYQIAFAADNTIGDEATWLTSLKGETGDTGATGPQGTQGDVGPIGATGQTGPQGVQGVAGTNGTNGLSAYQIAFAADNTIGDEATWLTSLKGETGDTGATGPQGTQGVAGTNGTNGLSAYQIAFAADDTIGDEATWLTSLKGETGDTGATGPQGLKGDTGLTGAQGAQGVAGTNGTNGLSAYQIAFAADNTIGDEATWLTSLKGETGNTGATGPQGIQGEQGPIGLTGATGSQGIQGEQGIQGIAGNDGQDGLSAYQVWLNAGNMGTETDFITSLTGPQGIQGVAGSDGVNGTNGERPADRFYLLDGFQTISTTTGTVFYSSALSWEGSPLSTVNGQKWMFVNQSGDVANEWVLATMTISPSPPYTGTQMQFEVVNSGTSAASIVATDVFISSPAGPQGVQGIAGTNGTNGLSAYQIAFTADNTIGDEATWLDSLQGLQGLAGNNSLIKTTQEPAGVNCANGGTKIEVGLDVNGNNILDNTEINVNQTNYVCNINTSSNIRSGTATQTSSYREIQPQYVAYRFNDTSDVTFLNPMPNTNYSVSIEKNSGYFATGGNFSGYILITNKTINGFTVEGLGGDSVTFGSYNGVNYLTRTFDYIAILHQ